MPGTDRGNRELVFRGPAKSPLVGDLILSSLSLVFCMCSGGLEDQQRLVECKACWHRTGHGEEQAIFLMEKLSQGWGWS